MKVGDIVSLIKSTKDTELKNIENGAYGVITNIVDKDFEVVFFHLERGETSKQILLSRENLKIIVPYENTDSAGNIIEHLSFVELINNNYSKQGILKGSCGVVMSEFCLNGLVLVDFGAIDDKGNYSGDVINVKCKDLIVKED